MTTREAIAVILHSKPAMMGLPTPDMIEAAKVFAHACRQTNDRLSRCEGLILKHQRSEALRQAAMEPDLFVEFGVLDIANCEQWAFYCSEHQMALPHELNRIASRTLEAARTTEKNLGDLLTQHRRLALARAPLASRLPTLRDLLKAEPNNTAWRDDLADYEQTRFGELQAELKDAVKTQAHDRVTGLCDEIDARGWSVPVPQGLYLEVKKVRAAARRDAIRIRAKPLAAKLKDAMDRGNLNGAIDVEEEIDGLMEEYKLSEDDPELAPFAEGLRWIERESDRQKVRRRFDSACDELRNALKCDFEWGSVQIAYEAVAAFQMSIPEELMLQYRARWRMAWLLRGLLLALLAAASLAGLIWFFNR